MWRLLPLLAGGVAFACAPAVPRGLAPRSQVSLTGTTSYASGSGYVAAVVAMAATALVVQNKGGGHGEIGYHLALKLAKEKGLKVTMIQDSACKQDKPPFNSYADLAQAGVEVKMADLSNGGLAAAMQGVQPCEYVFDNQNICPKDVQNLVKPWNPKVYAYVSSGGMYQVVPKGALVEGGAVKLDNKQLSIENHARQLGINWCAFRPQYIYGPKTNKRDYIDWFLDRITRDLPFPLPSDGSLFTTLTNSEDVAGMMAAVVGHEEAASGEIFNCAADELLSHVEVVKVIATALGKDPKDVLSKVVFYDPKALRHGVNRDFEVCRGGFSGERDLRGHLKGVLKVSWRSDSHLFALLEALRKGLELPKEGKFPFRETNFGVEVKKAKKVTRRPLESLTTSSSLDLEPVEHPILEGKSWAIPICWTKNRCQNRFQVSFGHTNDSMRLISREYTLRSWVGNRLTPSRATSRSTTRSTAVWARPPKHASSPESPRSRPFSPLFFTF